MEWAGRRLRYVFALLLGAAPPAWAQDSVSFDAQVAPILNQYCVMCHLPGVSQGGLDLYPEPWKQLVGIASTQSRFKRVEPGSPESSYLYAKLMGTQEKVGGSGLRMPFQQDPLSTSQLETIRIWIAQGAKSN